MNNEFDLYITSILKEMESQRYLLSHPFVGSEHLILSMLKNDKDIILIMQEYKVTYDTFYSKLVEVVGTCNKNVEFNLYTPLLKRVLSEAKEIASFDEEKIDCTLLLSLLLEEGEGVALRILMSMNVDLEELYDRLNEKTSTKVEELEFGKNLNKTVDINEKVVGREKEINFMIETLLRKKKNNPLLLGEAGVGKSAIIEEFARMINNKEVPKKLQSSQIISLEMSNLVSGTKYRGEFEEKLSKIIKEVEKNSNIILFIDEIHTVVSAGGAEGAIGAGDILKPHLARGNIKVIGATTTDEYNKFIKKDKALSRRFESVSVKEPTKEETINILNNVKGEYEKFHNVRISKTNIIDIVENANKFILNKKNPDKSLDFLDSIAAYCSIKSDKTNNTNKYLKKLEDTIKEKEKFVQNKEFDKAIELKNIEVELENKLSNVNTKQVKITIKDILKVLETKTNIPVLLNKNNLLKKLSNDLHEYTNKKDILDFVGNKLNKLDNISTMLLVGNDSKNIITTLKNNLENLNYIKINGNDISVNKMLGAQVGYAGYNDSHIFTSLSNNPYGLIHIDNYDQIDPSVKNLLLDIKNEGTITDNKGDDINFKNCIIVSTIKKDIKNKIGFDNQGAQDKNKYDELFDTVINCEKESLEKIN